MKFFTNKKFLFKLIACLCICLTLFNYCGISKVYAENDETVSKVGGKLLDPICSLLLALGDGAMEILHTTVMGVNAILIFDNPSEAWWQKVNWLWVGITIVIGAVAVGIIGLPALLAATAKLAAKVVIGTFLVDTLTGGLATTTLKASLSAVNADFFGQAIVLPRFIIGPEEIFKGRILLFDANVFNPKEVYEREDGTFYYISGGKEITTSKTSAALDLKDNIAKWYYVIRNIALIGLMLVLLYAGIKILFASVISEKAKHKQMLVDWVVALCLIFVMQYIMVFAHSVTEGVVNIFSDIADGNSSFAVIQNPSDKLVESMNELGDGFVVDGEDGKIIQWPTNLMGQIRVQAQQHDGTTTYIGYSLAYAVLVMFTIFFAFTYAKRLLYLLFLTLIAPFVALTYPLDKMRDGQAQAFNMWLKEYIINLIIQPFHLILYTVFVSMAFELAGTNILYSLVCLGFMIPAEKFLRSMFGFNKASTPGFLGGAAGAAMLMSGMKSLSSFAGKGPGGKGAGGKNSNGNGSDGSEKKKLRTSDPDHKMENAMDESLNEVRNLPEVANEDKPQDEKGDDENSDEEGKPGVPRLDDNPNDGTTPEGTNGDNPQREYDDDENPDEEDKPGVPRLDDNPNDGTTPEETLPEGKPSDGTPKTATQENRGQVIKRKLQTTLGKFQKTYAGARLSNFATNNFNKEKMQEIAKKGATGVVKVGLGATGAALGVAAGIASGSPGDVLKYGTAGGYAGSSIGQGLSNRALESMNKEKELHEEAMKKKLGSTEYKRIQNEKLDKEFKKDRQLQDKYAYELKLKNKEEVKKAMEEACEYRKYGITDNDAIIKAMKAAGKDENVGKNRASKSYIAATKMSSAIKSEDDLDKMMARYREKGASEAEVKAMRGRIRNINKNVE